MNRIPGINPTNVAAMTPMMNRFHMRRCIRLGLKINQSPRINANTKLIITPNIHPRAPKEEPTTGTTIGPRRGTVAIMPVMAAEDNVSPKTIGSKIKSLVATAINMITEKFGFSGAPKSGPTAGILLFALRA